MWGAEGPCCPLSVTVPAGTLQVPLGGTALLPAFLNVSETLPKFFQVRWRFLPTGRLVLLLVAHHCHGAGPWQEACTHGVELGQGYEARAGLMVGNLSLLLRGVRAPDAGNYCVTVLGHDTDSSATVSLRVEEALPETSPHPHPLPETTTAPMPEQEIPAGSTKPEQGTPVNSTVEEELVLEVRPVFKVGKVEDDGRGPVLANAVHLALSGMVLCFLGLIVGEHVLSARKKEALEMELCPYAVVAISPNAMGTAL
ncbi:uncharacterized protein LOC106737511 [Alligator mississippiensis]|uniref:uncharacterized protein LOC106737511 n=1 Tax=Alligator mississippiensis TaxID=8496 RepID=UPI0028777B5D|nr:uncharacterized protein LOC106737511 [Alligator mississippiensis]